jgi:hypothetical protein
MHRSASDLPPAEQILGDFDRLERSFAILVIQVGKWRR